MSLRHKFASEAPGREGAPQKALLALNLSPETIYDDLLKRSEIGGLDWATNSFKEIGAVDVYTGGFECQARKLGVNLDSTNQIARSGQFNVINLTFFFRCAATSATCIINSIIGCTGVLVRSGVR